MTWYRVRSQVARNIFGSSVSSGSGQLYALSDAGTWATPLNVRHVDGGTPMSAVLVTDWLTEECEVEDHYEVYWKSGSLPPVYLFSAEGMHAAAVAAKVAAQGAQDAAAVSADAAATSASAASAAANLVGAPADTAMATVVAAPGSEFRAAADTVYVPRAVTLAGAITNNSAVLDVESTVTSNSFALVRLKDGASHVGHMLTLSHYATDSASYGIDIANYPGARRALVIHQYSNASEAVVIDNTDSAPAVSIRNTENVLRNPGGIGSGDFLRFVRFGDGDLTNLSLTKDFVFLNNTTQGVIFRSSTVAALTVDHPAGPGVGLTVAQGVAGLYAGAFVGGAGVNVDATHTSHVLRVKNSHATAILAGFYNSAGMTASIANDGTYENTTAGAGVVLKSPDGTRYRVTVANGGTLAVAAA